MGPLKKDPHGRGGRVGEGVGGSICRVLRGSEALGGSFVHVLRVREAPGGFGCLTDLSQPKGPGGSAEEGPYYYYEYYFISLISIIIVVTILKTGFPERFESHLKL